MLTMFIIVVCIGGVIMARQNQKSGSRNNEKSIMQGFSIKEIKPYYGDNDTASYDISLPLSKEALQFYDGKKEGGKLDIGISTEEPAYIGKVFSKEELEAFFDKNENDILATYYEVFSSRTRVEISKNGFSILPLEQERLNVTVADSLAFPIRETDTGRWVGTLDVYRGEDGIHYQVSGDALEERVQEKLKKDYSGEIVAVCKYYDFYVIITSDQQVYGVDSDERKRLFSKLPFDDYYSFFLTNYNKANFDFS